MKTKGRGLEAYALCTEQTLLKPEELGAISTVPTFIKGMQREGTFASFFQEAIAIHLEVQELREKRLTCSL